MKDTMHARISIRLFCENKCFGPGIAELLRRVEKKKSLRAAALSMNMAYSKAWRIIKEAEKALGFALLSSVTGGANGGGAVLTAAGARLLRAYTAYVRAMEDAGNALYDEVFLPIFEGEG